MSLSLDDAAVAAPSAKTPTPFGVVNRADPYAPDRSAYDPDPANDVAARLRNMAEAKDTVEISIPAYDGLRERITLRGAAAKRYFSGGFGERIALVAGKIRETRIARATSGLQRLRAGAAVELLPPLEEAALREFGAFETREIVREANGQYERVEVDVLREDFGVDSLDSSAQSKSPLDNEYLQWSGPLGKQLYYNDVLDQGAKCFWAYNHDPIAHEACSLIRNFVVGRGVSVACNDERVQAICDEFTESEGIQDRIKSWAVSLSRDGEIFVRLIRPGDGSLRVRSLDPMTIWEVVTDAEDIETIYYYVQRYLTRTQIITPPGGAGQVWIDRYLDPRDVVHAKVNVSESEVRGRSDLYPVLGYFKRLRDLVETLVTREQSQAAYIHDYTVKGSASDVSQFAANGIPQGKVTPGSSFVHNDAVDVKVLQPQASRSTDAGSVYEGLITLIAVGLGIAKDYLGITSRGSRATALVATAPSAMRFEERQNVISSVIRRVYDAAISEARAAGRLEGVADFGFQISFAAIQKDDSASKVDLINQGVGMTFISHKTASSLFASELDLDDYDYDAEQDQIAEELGKRPYILAKYAAIPFGDAATGAVGAQAGDPSTSGGDMTPSSGAGAAQIRRDLGPGARESWSSFTERYAGGYA